MSKDQVSGSLTLSLSGLADAVADVVAARVEQTFREVNAPPQLQVYSRDALIGVLTGLGLDYATASQLHTDLTSYGLAMIALPEGMTQEVPQEPAAHADRPGPAETFFREGV